MSKQTFSVRIDEQNDKHTKVSVFNRGGLSGHLTILTEDADEFARRVCGAVTISQSVDTIEGGAHVVGVKIDRLG